MGFNNNGRRTSFHIFMPLLIFFITLCICPVLLSDEFWFRLSDRICGEARCLCYVGLLCCALYAPITRHPHGDSPLQTRNLIRYGFPSEFVSPQGIMNYLSWFYKDGAHLDIYHWTLCISWVLCILGLGGQTPVILHALCFLIGVGANTGLIGISHRWFIPAYTFACLCLVDARSTFSLDRYLCHVFASDTDGSKSNYFNSNPYPFCPLDDLTSNGSIGSHPKLLTKNSILISGFASQWISILCIYTLVSGGFSKLMNEGLSWGDGESMKFYVSCPSGTFAPMKAIITKVPGVAMFLSITTLLFELGSIVAIFGYFRLELIVMAWLFHLGIWMTMKPNYLPQSICYLLMINFNFRKLLEATDLASAASSFHNPKPLSFVGFDFFSLWAGSGYDLIMFEYHALAVILSLAFVAVLIYTTYNRIEYYPLTAIPMYSFRRSGMDYNALDSYDQLLELAREHVNSGYPRTLGWGLWIDLQLRSYNGGKTEQKGDERPSDETVINLLDGKYVSRKEVITLINHHVCVHLMTPNHTVDDGPAVLWLKSCVVPFINRLQIMKSCNNKSDGKGNKNYTLCLVGNFANGIKRDIARLNIS